MKKFFVIIVTSISLLSCTKQVSTPSGAGNQNIFFQDAHVSVENIRVTSTSTGIVTVSFSTVFENNISRIELMSSATPNTFCLAQSVDITGNSSVKKNYSFSDVNAKGNTMYYLLRFKNNLGDWTYSNYINVQVN